MEPARPDGPARDTGLPPGVRVGSLGRRFVAFLIDSLIPVGAGLMLGAAARGDGGGATVALVGVALLLVVAWALVCWQQLALHAASPGMRAMRLQLVGFFDGRPVRWGRVLLRWLVLVLLSTTVVGLLLLIVSVLVSPRRQGWHDRAISAVVIVERPLAPLRTKVRTSRSTIPTSLPERPPASGPRPTAPAPTPVPAPAPAPVAGDPALPPDLAPVAPAAAAVEPHPTPDPTPDPSTEPEPTPEPVAPPEAAARNGHRTILQGWVAELDDGREIPVRGLVLLGRNPRPGEGEDDAELVKVADDSRTVSKTHLALGVDDAGLFVVDRGSTNGSTVTPPGGTAEAAGAFHAVSVAEGSVVSIGDHWVRIRRDEA